MLGTSKSIESALNIQPTISSEMINAIELWGDMYTENAPWLKEATFSDPVRITSLGLPSFIAREKARMCTLEMKSEITPPVTDVAEIDETTGFEINKRVYGTSERADFLNEQYKNTILKDIKTQIEYGIAKGGLVIKPYPIIIDNEDGTKTARIYIDYIQADGFYPISFDASGKITEAAFVQKMVDKEYTYSRLEYHKLENGIVTVINRAYRASNKNGADLANNELGNEVPLSTVSEWASFEPEVTLKSDRLLFAYFKVPVANTIDTYSPLGVSAYSRAVNLIKDADMQYSRILWEYEGGELAIDIDRDALKTEEINGKTVEKLDKFQSRLYRKVDLESTYSVFSPALRDSSLFNGLNNILMRIEDVCELARGTVADVNAEARTATEIAILKQRSYAANVQMQDALETALRESIEVMDIYASLYEITPDGEYEVSFEWDDSIQVDKESEMNKRRSLVMDNISSKVEFRQWYYGETEEQALQALRKVQQYNRMEAQENYSTEETGAE